MSGTADFAVSTGIFQNRVMITENTTWRVPVGVKRIIISACAAGGAPEAGEFILDKYINVVPGQEINIIVGRGNTIIGNFQTLIAASIRTRFINSKLSFRTGFNGARGSGIYQQYFALSGGFGGAFGFGGGGGVYAYRNGGNYVIRPIGEGGSDSDGKPCTLTGSYYGECGGGGGGGDGGTSTAINTASREDAKGGDAGSGVLYNNGGVTENAANGGSGSIYGGGAGGAGLYVNVAGLSYISGGGGAGGYGAGGGIGGGTVTSFSVPSITGQGTANGGGAPGMVLIEW